VAVAVAAAAAAVAVIPDWLHIPED
jgi:hypothetical protein